MAIILLVLIGLLGLALDTGLVVLAHQQLQHAADAAALAAVAHVRSDLDAARDAAVAVAGANAVLGVSVAVNRNDENADPEGDVVIGRYDRDTGEFQPQETGGPNAVQVMARRTDATHGGVPLVFGPVFGVNFANRSAEAIAMIGGGAGPAGLAVLNRTEPCALDMRGTIEIRVLNVFEDPPGKGVAQVNSSHDTAVCSTGTPTLDAAVLKVKGDVDNRTRQRFEGEIITNSPPIDDPLGFVPEPDWSGWPNLGTIGSGVGDYGPGYYSGGISTTGGTITLSPGIYVLDGAGLQVGGNANLEADGVMLFIVDSAGSGSHVNLGGAGTIQITAPDPDIHGFADSDVYEGISIFQARNNTNTAEFAGGAGLDLDGTLYFPSNRVEIVGGGGQIGSQLVLDTLTVRGTGVVHLNYDGNFPAPGNEVFLVR